MEVIKAFMKTKENVKNIYKMMNAKELQKFCFLYDQGNKGYKKSGKKCLENSGAVFNSIFLINKGPSHTLKGLTFFFTTFSKMCIIQIT